MENKMQTNCINIVLRPNHSCERREWPDKNECARACARIKAQTVKYSGKEKEMAKIVACKGFSEFLDKSN